MPAKRPGGASPAIDEDHDPLAGQPDLLREIAEVAGIEAAITLADRYGGNRRYIPREAGPGHWLTACVGQQAADLLCDHFAGIEIELPIGTLTKAERQARLQRLICMGWTSSEITRALGCTRRTVKRHRAAIRRRIDGVQLDMFPEPTEPRLPPRDERVALPGPDAAELSRSRK